MDVGELRGGVGEGVSERRGEVGPAGRTPALAKGRGARRGIPTTCRGLAGEVGRGVLLPSCAPSHIKIFGRECDRAGGRARRWAIGLRDSPTAGDWPPNIGPGRGPGVPPTRSEGLRACERSTRLSSGPPAPTRASPAPGYASRDARSASGSLFRGSVVHGAPRRATRVTGDGAAEGGGTIGPSEADWNWLEVRDVTIQVRQPQLRIYNL